MRALILLLLSPLAAAEEMSCPLELPPEAITVRAPAGWLATVPSMLRLTDGGVMRGHPLEKGYLVPDRTNSARNGGKRTYVFDVGEERWLWCAYGSLSPQLSKRLSDVNTECTLTYQEAKYTGITQMAVACRPQPDARPTGSTGAHRPNGVPPPRPAAGKRVK